MVHTIDMQRKSGLLFLTLGIVVFLTYAFMHDIGNPEGGIDFKAQYFPTRTLLHHADPYDPQAVFREYASETANARDDSLTHLVATHYPYPPVIFLLTAGLGALPYATARIVWTILNATGLIVACVMTWCFAAEIASEISGILIAIMLVGGETVLASGNVAALAIALCVFGVYSFVRSKHVAAGVVCLAISLLLKPQDTGLVWLYFLICSNPHRRRALAVLLTAVCLSIPSIIWVTEVAPDWRLELSRNLFVYTTPGGINDPAPTSGATPGSLVNLQVILSHIWSNSTFFNDATYLICASLVLIVLITAARSRLTAENIWMPLASITAFTLLVVYHRRYDTKLLLLAIPACAQLWVEGRRLGKIALGITGACVLFTSDSAWVFAYRTLYGMHISKSGAVFKTLEDVFVIFPAPLTLLAVGVLFLWVYVRRAGATAERKPSSIPGAQ